MSRRPSTTARNGPTQRRHRRRVHSADSADANNATELLALETWRGRAIADPMHGAGIEVASEMVSATRDAPSSAFRLRSRDSTRQRAVDLASAVLNNLLKEVSRRPLKAITGVRPPAAANKEVQQSGTLTTTKAARPQELKSP
jgi:cell envelope opacity-associated protein A